MPELPEVETVKNQLSNIVLNKEINKITTSDLKLRGGLIPNKALQNLIGDSFLHIYRRNKYLILESQYSYLVIHLGMTGQLLHKTQYPNEKHVHMVIEFKKQEYFYYLDIRRFGKIEIYSKKEYSDYHTLPPFENLGFEPLDENFTVDAFNKLIKNNKNPAKKFLMEAKYVCGIGNIYANEILFLTNINPLQAIGDISISKQKLLHDTIISVLKRAIELGGSSISDFVHINGSSGQMQNFYKVYGRENKPCFVCSNTILKIKQNGRSSFFCPYCQPLIEK